LNEKELITVENVLQALKTKRVHLLFRISQIYCGVLSVSSFLYRGSLQTSCGTWSKIKIKHRLLSTKISHDMNFYGKKVNSCSKDFHSFSFGM